MTLALAVWKKSKIGASGVIAYSRGCSEILFTLEYISRFNLPSMELENSIMMILVKLLYIFHLDPGFFE